MKKIVLLFALFALFTQNIEAKSVTVDQAMAIAKQFGQTQPMLKAGAQSAMKLGYAAMNMKGQNDYFVFNRDGGNGFVIVAGDDLSIPVLGYSDKG
jgi:hypothetical protein